jgi:Transglutaminase-like superfamily
MSGLFLRAYRNLVLFDLYLARGDFGALRNRVRDCPTRIGLRARPAVEVICAAIDVACIWYWKEVLCLQRSAATACLLRRHGVDAQLVIGAQQLPFQAHAWVEVNARVVNDKPYMHEMYAEIDRC